MISLLVSDEREYQIVNQLVKLLRQDTSAHVTYQITITPDRATYAQISPSVAPKGMIKLTNR